MKQSIREVDSPNLTSRFPINRRGDLPPPPCNENVEYRRPSILNTPLPPLPCDSKKPVTEPCGSNRSSSSGSSIYGHFFPEGSDEEEIYTHPNDKNTEVPANIPISPLSAVLQPPPLPNRPRSVALTSSSESKISNDRPRPQTSPPRDTGEDYSHPRGYPFNRLVSPNVPVKWLQTPDGISDKILSSLSPGSSPKGSARNSWSEQSLLQDEAPPLPPRGNEKRMVSSWTGAPQNEESKPALPRRLIKKTSIPAMTPPPKDIHVPILCDSQEIPSPLLTPVATTPSPISESALQQEVDNAPPPLPNKRTTVGSSSNPASLSASP
ncbi:hypothetical protein X975_23040, partial [Stegodyphus mimosarum]